MLEPVKRYLITCLVVLMAMAHAVAQPKSVGTTYSLSGIGIMYEHNLNGDCFIETDIRAEMGEVFRNATDIPGISASFSCNFVFKEWKSTNGSALCAFAGPGISAGIVNDLHKDRGYFFGIKGRVGLEGIFDRRVSISVSLNPIIGSHLIVREEYLEMAYYRNGLLNAILPEIGIKFLFRK